MSFRLFIFIGEQSWFPLLWRFPLPTQSDFLCIRCKMLGNYFITFSASYYILFYHVSNKKHDYYSFFLLDTIDSAVLSCKPYLKHSCAASILFKGACIGKCCGLCCLVCSEYLKLMPNYQAVFWFSQSGSCLKAGVSKLWTGHWLFADHYLFVGP